MRTRTQIEPNRLLSRQSPSRVRRCGARIFPNTDFIILAIRYKNHGRPQIGISSALEMSGELRHMGSPMKRPLEVYPAAWPGSKLIGIENVALSPGVFRHYHHRIVGVESESMFRAAE
jgi:hypothetical protein